MSALEGRLQAGLAAVRAADLFRLRRVVEGAHAVQMRVDGRDCINFCSNDYLGLAADPRLTQAATTALGRCGVGSGSSPYISGYNAEQCALEEELAEFLGRERALVFSSGWAANLGVLRALLGREDWVLADALNHASLIDGARLSGARYHRVAHAQVAAYAAALDTLRPERSSAGGLALLLTDGVFSMDGDVAPLPELLALARREDAALMVDDAHGFGVLGACGRGSAEAAGLAAGDIPVLMATLGKSAGAAGAFVSGSDALIEFLVQRARTAIFSTAPPPALAAAARAGLRLMRSEPERRVQLRAHIAHFRRGALQRGLALVEGIETPIQPLLIGDAARTMSLSRALLARGYWVAGIRPPTVPLGSSRLRITLSTAHRPEQIEGLLDALVDSLAALPRAAAAA